VVDKSTLQNSNFPEVIGTGCFQLIISNDRDLKELEIIYSKFLEDKNE